MSKVKEIYKQIENVVGEEYLTDQDFMIPRYIRFIDKLPRNKVHRILKQELKKIGITSTTYDREIMSIVNK